ncbi:conserved hypothetical protein; putative signal peptide [Bradyrhizobium sp. ORS 285]|uniref:hypothetical protein n=1 Tax=Bradyrhizobium sp. ORS 285 TaxID=115808 RepID=UPI0002409569|nr:hypothetical protein [Bradyrhizobium sp. ORS 285]CCD89230.1 conserved exported hypothetical protein [Bradyrhizobium sp. ORS 285]SMX59487.1 conserved hypothetical protein; putative signal peptide [Bradyrhizobium sp. ORS 285]
MMNALLAAGALAVLAGLGAIAWGIPVKEFSLGNTLILSGTLGVCSGLILFGLSAVLSELKVISHRLRTRNPSETEVRPLQLPGAMTKPELDTPPVPPSEDMWREGGSPRPRPRMPDLSGPLSSAPRPPPPMSSSLSATLRAASVEEEADEPPAQPAERPRRNLLFASSSRRERERADKRPAEPMPTDFSSPPLSEPPATPIDEPAPEPSPPALDDNWSRPERTRASESLRPPFPRRLTRAAPAFVEPEPAPVPEPQETEAPAASIIKSGVVDGMAYSLYSDGSIEAQMPEGMMRFASIDELRTHLEGRA